MSVVDMIGHTDKSSPSWLWQMARGESRGLTGLCALSVAMLALAGTAGCTQLDEGEESFCDLNPGVGECGLSDPWWCLDQTPPDLPLPEPGRIVGFVLPVVEWGSKLPLAGRNLQAKLCSVTDYTCNVGIAPPYMVQNGMLGGMPLPAGAAGVPVPQGFDAFVKFEVLADPSTPEGDRFVPDTYYMGGTVTGNTQGAPLLMIQRKDIQTIITQSFGSGVDVNMAQNLGVIAFQVYDCDNRPAGDTRVDIRMLGREPEGVIPYQLPASRIPIAQVPGQPLYTAASGGGGFLNVPAGTVQLSAYRRDGVPIGVFELGSVPGEISVGSIRPAYLRDANIVGAPAIENGG